MATADQLKSLIQTHFKNDSERFTSLALQLAAYEARQGHTALAHEIREIVDESKKSQVQVIPLHKDLEDLVLLSTPQERLSNLIVNDATKKRIKRIIHEFRQQSALKKHGLNNRRKLLLTGPPGTGKTMTASILARELHLPLLTVLMDKLITKFMGETSAKLRQIFNVIQEKQGVYLFDEIDAIGGERARENDVGEMRRVLNAFLQFIEQDPSDSLIVAATNNISLLDQALFRRFDDVIHYENPSKEEAKQLIENRIANFKPKRFPIMKCVNHALSLSHGEIAQACDDAIKDAILNEQTTISGALLQEMLDYKKSAYNKRQ
ncbi:AAA family ATPase [bacterium]|nr:AAA family ATPase [bacterium]